MMTEVKHIVECIVECIPHYMPDGHWIDGHGREVWIKDGNYHRTDGPAVEDVNGNKEWYLNGKLHRTDGPAYEWADGTKEWWWRDDYHDFDEWLMWNNAITDNQKVLLKLKYG